MNVIFDLDGTLTNPRQGILACFKHAFDVLKVESPQDAALEEFIGPPLHESFSRIFGPDCQGMVREAIVLYRECFASKGMFENQVYPGIADILAELHERGERLFVATVKPRVFAERILEHFRLERFFRAVYGSELDGTNSDKRDLLPYLLVAESLPAAESVMIGDRGQDVCAANASGIVSIGALWGYGSREELVEAGALLLCEEPKLIADAVAKVHTRTEFDSDPSPSGGRLG